MTEGKRGIVYLVGAGPGDPGLFTLRGAELLAAADVVVYDNLANPLLLMHCPNARTIYVGKQSSAHTLTQDQINALLVEQAQLGQTVVRLKGGDPYVFGRGGEEGQFLRAAGIPFEEVPGITAAIAAAAYAGIPVTHRDFNSSFSIITGHEQEGGTTEMDWPIIARLPCMAFYMGMKSLPHICAQLIAHGKPPTTPAACIQWGTMPRQRTVVATLGDLPEKIAAAGLQPPAITIVGRVVELHSTLNWFENRPLFGRSIVVTRTRQQASDLSRKLSALGATIWETPTLEVAAPKDQSAIERALKNAGSYDWLVFTSANGVEFARNRLAELNLDVRAFGSAKIAAIGDATAAAIRNKLSLRVDLCPKSFVAEALAEELIAGQHVAGKKFLLLRADIARPILVEKLKAAGASSVDDIAIYESHPAKSLPAGLTAAIDAGHIDWITFASASSAKNFVALLGDNAVGRLSKTKIASIGPITTAAIKELGLKLTTQAEIFNIDGLVAAISAATAPK